MIGVKFNVLVVEDEPISLEMLVHILQSTGKVNTFAAQTGEEALALFKNNSIDCTFLDIGIPAPDGIEILKKIREIDEDANVVMQTANSNLKTVKLALSLGAASYIVKPYEPEKIIDVFNQFIS